MCVCVCVCVFVCVCVCMCVCVCVCVRRCIRSEEHTSELQSHLNLVCRLLLEKKKKCTILREHVRWLSDLVTRRACMCAAAHVARDIAHLAESRTRVLAVTVCFFFNDTATTEIYPLSLHDALPILCVCACVCGCICVYMCMCVCGGV